MVLHFAYYMKYSLTTLFFLYFAKVKNLHMKQRGGDGPGSSRDIGFLFHFLTTIGELDTKNVYILQNFSANAKKLHNIKQSWVELVLGVVGTSGFFSTERPLTANGNLAPGAPLLC